MKAGICFPPSACRWSLLVLAVSLPLLGGADWTRFRGPGGSGIAEDTGVPTEWSSDKNIAWKTAMPGFGASSPITLGDQIFVACYSGYGLDEDEPGDMADLKHHLLCVNRADGKILWEKVTPGLATDQEYVRFMPLHGYASASPVTDGKAVYAFFGCAGVYAYDLSGKSLWHASVGEGIHGWGSGTSPILTDDAVIINASVESGSIVALDKATGEQKWKFEGIKESWSTPLVVKLPGGGQELVVSMHSKILGLDPATGEQLWECAGVPDYVVPAVIADDQGVVYVTGGRKPTTVAIRTGGRGDVSETHVVWHLKETGKVPTPLLYDGHLYWVSNMGFATCVDAKTGEMVYKERLEGVGRVYASLVLADEKLYAVSRENGAVVLAASPRFRELGRNELADDTSVFNATPVVSNGQLLLRSDKFLYCVGK